MIARVDAAQATLDRFKDQPFEWGRFDCAKMVAFHLRKLGHQIGISKAGSYSSALGAKRALNRLGWPNISHALDEVLRLERIAPAFLVTGDVIQMPSEGAIDAMGIALGNGRALAYYPGEIGAVVVQPMVEQILAAWRAV